MTENGRMRVAVVTAVNREAGQPTRQSRIPIMAFRYYVLQPLMNAMFEMLAVGLIAAVRFGVIQGYKTEESE